MIKVVDDAIKACMAVLVTGVPVERSGFSKCRSVPLLKTDTLGHSGTQSVSILLPVLLRLVEPTSSTPPLRPTASAHLVALATSAPSHFKEATAALDAGDRTLLEESIRSALGQGSKRTAAGSHAADEAPRIELKMFG